MNKKTLYKQANEKKLLLDQLHEDEKIRVSEIAVKPPDSEVKSMRLLLWINDETILNLLGVIEDVLLVKLFEYDGEMFEREISVRVLISQKLIDDDIFPDDILESSVARINSLSEEKEFTNWKKESFKFMCVIVPK